ncbi:MAG: multifunctional oxoglutarate decarboxylase/oxoglutarate dehydrogenase thiamine pyrophosphate-binding subunit/dihydrolipoyllysine-residue succinyltransferase subunit, partial [Actinobacteria bacterium]|nr:multifunctional oxoglutarate decarboxylase/oxoglutarate dehydrogenase thiamine pyrophosphate-binding subunit/dihydrolipoyllysine-residue succinyltransferase subunit [Actinomycetota bacterium]
TITNPGTLGTERSIPRLMVGQAAIIGVGAIGYPAEFEGSDPRALAELGVGKVLTLTSTYDHRVIQGAESGEFLSLVHDLLLGARGFYDALFHSIGVPSVPVQWRRDENPVDPLDAEEKRGRVLQLINIYRVRGHLIAPLDPLQDEAPAMHPELEPATYGFTIWDLDRPFPAGDLAGRKQATLGEILGILRDAYCRTATVEYMHIQEPAQKQWIQERVEGVPRPINDEDRRQIVRKLNEAEVFERFLHRTYMGHKRFSLEGAESLIPILDAVLDRAADAGLAETVIGMAHRGRLNVLANTIGKSYAQIFREFEGDIDPSLPQGSGDVKYHIGASGEHTSRAGARIKVSVASNPSHLESVDPVVEGIVRAKQDVLNKGEEYPVLAVLVHGDAAFAGQGVVQEALNMSQLRGYRTGGTVHVVVNNQLGYTTGPMYARSSTYATDIARMIQAPIFHVNGDDPEACVVVARLAFAFRQAFHKDVVIDMWCYRRWGHNETDDPALTQPLMYEKIVDHPSVRTRYTQQLTERGNISEDEARRIEADFEETLAHTLEETKTVEAPPTVEWKRPAPLRGTAPEDTAVAREQLDRVAGAITSIPEDFHLHRLLQTLQRRRREALDKDQVDWSLAELLAFGTLVLDGTTVRVSGQDTRRGTFSQRHAVVVDQEDGSEIVPLQRIEGATGRFFIYDSLLSEFAALGFEYGYTVGDPDALVCWEAQFGDFVNGAQVIVDGYITAAEDKWAQTSSLVLLLPHGYEGQGPEHSSARLERFLQLGAEDNIQVVVPSTPAQYFHVLRRQIYRAVRKPLVVMTHKAAMRMSLGCRRSQSTWAPHHTCRLG